MSVFALVLMFSGSLEEASPAEAQAAPFPRFRDVTVDGKVGIGYGVAVADVDGDQKTDIVLVDKDVVAWYRNPGWEKFVIAEKLTKIDHVSIAARDIDGDGKAEIAVGAGWNPSDTIGSGSVHYLVAPADRTQRWEPVELPHEPTVHRMKWLLDGNQRSSLLVVPLHGRGNKQNEGAGVKVLAYQKPSDPKAPWGTELLDDSLHMTHNFDLVQWDEDPAQEILLAAKEGVFLLNQSAGKWSRRALAKSSPEASSFAGASEVRAGRLPGGKRFFATIEPFHGNRVVSYSPPPDGGDGLWTACELDASLKGGHAVACGDLMGAGFDQVVAGWREKDKEGKVGIRAYVPLDGGGKRWERRVIDDNTMACEDLVLTDLDGDKRLDVVASGRDSNNLKVYFNQGSAK
jgi:hypothetical protein